MDLQESHFTYTPLPVESESDSIRVIERLPDVHPAPVSCIVRHVRLNEKPRFEATSYCWGNPEPPKFVICNGKSLNITESPYIALHRLRNAAEPRTLWADAICINQQDIDEKNTQAPLVRKIYEMTEQVVLWLGEEEHNSHLGFALIPKLVAAHNKREATSDQRTFMHLQDPGIRAVYDLPNRRGGQDFPGYFGIFKRPWFGRGWVI